MTVTLETWNQHRDGWIEAEAALHVEGCAEIVLGFYLPKHEGEQQDKTVAVFDGAHVHDIVLRRGEMVASPAIAVGENGRSLYICVDGIEKMASGDERRLGAVLQVLMPSGVDMDCTRRFGRDRPESLSLAHPEAAVVESSFDADFYVRQFTSRAAPDNPLLHYLVIGWKMGLDPSPRFPTVAYQRSGSYDPTCGLSPFAHFCISELSERAVVSGTWLADESEGAEGSGSRPADLVALWHDIVPEIAADRPDFRFDARFYRQTYPDLAGMPPEDHFRMHGASEARLANMYSLLKARDPTLDASIAALVAHPHLRAAVENGHPGAFELVFELMALGSPIDQLISDFSASHYLELYPDVRDSGIAPLQHFLMHGVHEGRRSLRELRQQMRPGEQSFDANRPTCLICSHEFSRTGAPMVALQLAREAAEHHNVVVAALRDGEIAEMFKPYAVAVVVTPAPFDDMRYLDHPAVNAISFAVLNSVESVPFAKWLVAREIPYASYVHEYTEYTLPTYKAKFTALFSDKIAFSSEHVRSSWMGIASDLKFDLDRDSFILPQEALPATSITRKEIAAARAHLGRVLNIDCAERRIIYGAGQVQLRKGTDLFAMTAQHVRDIDPSVLFVWIGDGMNHEDITYGVWLDLQLRELGANDPDGNLFFIPAGPHYHDVCRAADAMFLSSRLDPLPNVVFDAVRYGAHVVLFDQASGFCDERYGSSALIHTVPYGNLAAAADALLALPRKPEVEHLDETPAKPVGGTGAFHEIKSRLMSDIRESDSIAGSYDVPIMFASSDSQTDYRRKERAKLHSYGRLMVWDCAEHAARMVSDSGGWVHARSRIAPHERVSVDEMTRNGWPDYAIHIHAHYTTDLAQDFLHFAAYQHASCIIVTTDTEAKADEVLKMAQAACLDVEVMVRKNRGRDILPFLEMLDEDQSIPDDLIWCHVHQKKSIGSADTGDAWRGFLLKSLLGGGRHVTNALHEISRDATGLVTALDPYAVGWDTSRRFIPDLEKRIGAPLPEHPLVFPVGNMFWTRTSVVRRMMGLFTRDYPWPNEPIANDGTIYHAIERLWPAVASLDGRDSVFLDTPSVRRV